MNRSAIIAFSNIISSQVFYDQLNNQLENNQASLGASHESVSSQEEEEEVVEENI